MFGIAHQKPALNVIWHQLALLLQAIVIEQTLSGFNCYNTGVKNPSAEEECTSDLLAGVSKIHSCSNSSLMEYETHALPCDIRFKHTEEFVHSRFE